MENLWWRVYCVLFDLCISVIYLDQYLFHGKVHTNNIYMVKDSTNHVSTKMTIYGKVQNVELRAPIKAIVDNLGVCGAVGNLLDRSVLVICEAEPDVIEEMVRQIRHETKLAVIRDIKTKHMDPATGMTGFVVIWKDSVDEILNGIHAGRKRDCLIFS